MRTATKDLKGAQEITLTDLCFPVDLNVNPRVTNKEYSRVVTGIIDNIEMDLNYCSPVYELVKNEDIFPQIEDTLFSNKLAYNVVYKHINHVRFYAEYTLTDPSLAYSINGTDKIMPMIRVNHSYNGLTKYAINFGYYRLVCSNGLTIPLEEMNEYNLAIMGKHTDSVKRSFKMLEVILQKFVDEKDAIVAKIASKYVALATKTVVNVEERIETVLKASGINVVDNKNKSTLQEIVDTIKMELSDPLLGYTSANDWLIYNGINRYIHNDKNNIAAPEKRYETDSKVLEYMLAN